MSTTPNRSQYAEGYAAARSFYESRTFLAGQAAEAWRALGEHSKGPRTREVLRAIHPELFRALEALDANEHRAQQL